MHHLLIELAVVILACSVEPANAADSVQRVPNRFDENAIITARSVKRFGSGGDHMYVDDDPKMTFRRFLGEGSNTPHILRRLWRKHARACAACS